MPLLSAGGKRAEGHGGARGGVGLLDCGERGRRWRRGPPAGGEAEVGLHRCRGGGGAGLHGHRERHLPGLSLARPPGRRDQPTGHRGTVLSMAKVDVDREAAEVSELGRIAPERREVVGRHLDGPDCERRWFRGRRLRRWKSRRARRGGRGRPGWSAGAGPDAGAATRLTRSTQGRLTECSRGRALSTVRRPDPWR